MYWDWDHERPEIKERVYDDAAEYGICCDIQDLNQIVSGLNKYLKKTKVRGAGLDVRFGASSSGGPGISDTCWREWEMGMGASKKNVLTAEQGLLWHFALAPNRHFHISADGAAEEVYAFPDRWEFAYIVSLYKRNCYYFRDGQLIDADSEDVRRKRETFFQGLLDSIGFPLEVLYVYDKDEFTWGCPLWGTWENTNGKWMRYIK